ncbi:MAG: hypothetical protein ACFB9N_09580 [Geitlerinemataceae cyanobacterium]
MRAGIFGGGGNDAILAEGGFTFIFGGPGNDSILAEEGFTSIFGDRGNDSIYVAEDRNEVFGDEGNDTIRGGEGGDFFGGDAGDDYLIASQRVDDRSRLFGNEGRDTLIAGPNADVLYGGKGDDLLVAGSDSNAELFPGNSRHLGGDNGDDTLIYDNSVSEAILNGDGGGTDPGGDLFQVTGDATGLLIFGGAGSDSLEGTLGAEAEVYMGKGDDYFQVNSAGSSIFSGDFGDDVGSIVSAGDDTILGDPAEIGTDGSAGADTLSVSLTGGQAFIYGDDTNNSAAGNDSIVVSGNGSAIVFGGGGNDYLDGSANQGVDTLDGGSGNDIYVFGPGDVIPFDSLGANTYIAGPGVTSDVVITVTANDSFSGGATFVVAGEFELIRTLPSGGLVSSDGRDLITIGTANGLTDLRDGDDTLNITNLTETGSVFGGDGNDVFNVSGIVNGLLSGGDGVDIFNIDTLGAGASIDAGAGDERIVISAIGTESSTAATVSGGDGDDTTGIAYIGENVPEGSSTALPLVLNGGAGNDLIYGKVSGGDLISGGAGDDTLYGGGFGASAASSGVASRRDTLVGGAGADVFVLGSSAKTGFIEAVAGAGTEFFNVSPYVTDGSTAATTTKAVYNGIEHVDIIQDFDPTEDILLLNTRSGIMSTFGALNAGTSARQLTTYSLESGSLAYLANNTSASGFLLGANGNDAGTANSLGIMARTNNARTLDMGGIVTGEVDAFGFTYDTDTGALYLSGFLTAIFSSKPSLRDENIQAIGFADTSNAIVLI